MLGLAIYITNPRYQKTFSLYLERSQYQDRYKYPHEEFFYRWGLATLFHDIAYPIELTLKQAQEYVQLLTSYVCEGTQDNNTVLFNIPGFRRLHEVPLIQPLDCEKNVFCKKYPKWDAMPFQETSEKLLAHHVAQCVSLSFEDVHTELAKQKGAISEKGFVDHGYYGAVTLIKWSHRLVLQGKWNPAYFYYPILDSASAILLHNWYKYGLQQKPFNLGPLKSELHPIAWLLILCDEVQEWGRKEYQAGLGSFYRVPSAEILVDAGILSVSYHTDSVKTGEKLCTKKEAIEKIVDFEGDFQLRVSVPE